MSQSNMEVMGRSFRTKQDYDLALKDAERIDRLKKNTDFDNIEEVRELLEELHTRQIRFMTILGDDFIEEVEERELYLVQNPPQAKKKKGKAVKTPTKKTNVSSKINKKKPKDFDEYDPEMQARILEELKRQEKKRKISVVLLSLLATACLAYVFFYYYQYGRSTVDYDNLAQLKEKDTEKAKENGYKEFIVSVNRQNSNAIQFYRSMGGEVIDTTERQLTFVYVV